MKRESTKIENGVARALRRYFGEDNVKTQWTSSKNASDAFRRNKFMYAPRPDVAVGPFSVGRGSKYETIHSEFEKKTPKKLRVKFSEKINTNPRCLFSIEIVCGGSTKHILGDITNASVMGLYGIIISGSKEMGEKVDRILNFLKTIKEEKLSIGRAESWLFENVLIISREDFMKCVK